MSISRKNLQAKRRRQRRMRGWLRKRGWRMKIIIGKRWSLPQCARAVGLC